MKKLICLSLLIFVLPFASAYSIADVFEELSDFFKGYFELTGNVILEFSEKSTDLGTENLENIEPEEEDVESDLCKDSDLFDPNQKGICKSLIKKSQDYCSEDGRMVMEYYCNDDSLCVGSWYVCQGKCLEGRCVENVES